MSGLILLPTLNRTKLLKNFVESYVETKATVDMWILVDDVDYHNNQAEYDAIQLPETVEIISTGSAVSMGDKVRHVWEHVDDYKWIGLLNDDHYCITPEWDKKAYEMLDGTNMLSTNDGFWNFGFRVVGLTAWSKPLLDACDFPIFPDHIDHLFIDDIWKAIGESTGCWKETMKINIEHRHVFCGKSPEDDTFKKVNNQAKYQEGLKAFTKFMEQDFKTVCEKILNMRSTHVHANKFV